MKFSVITVTYNAQEVIEATIASVQEQTFTDFEYIVIDGASTDLTTELLRKYNSLISTLVIEKDKGIYDAMNKGIKHATGEFILFLNAGDRLYSPDTLKIVANNVSTDTKIISGEYVIVEDTKTTKGNFIKTKPCTLPFLRKDFYACHQSIFIHSSIISEFNQEYKLLADYKSVLDAQKGCSSNEINHIQEPIVYYLKGGVSDIKFLENLGERIKLHYQEFGVLQVVLNTTVYLRRIAREFKRLRFS